MTAVLFLGGLVGGLKKVGRYGKLKQFRLTDHYENDCCLMMAIAGDVLQTNCLDIHAHLGFPLFKGKLWITPCEI